MPASPTGPGMSGYECSSLAQNVVSTADYTHSQSSCFCVPRKAAKCYALLIICLEMIWWPEVRKQELLDQHAAHMQQMVTTITNSFLQGTQMMMTALKNPHPAGLMDFAMPDGALSAP